MATKQEKQIEKAVDAAFLKHGNQIEFNIFDLGKISTAGVKAGLNGANIEEAVITAINQYRLDRLP